jgi:hypothetical protein
MVLISDVQLLEVTLRQGATLRQGVTLLLVAPLLEDILRQEEVSL